MIPDNTERVLECQRVLPDAIVGEVPASAPSGLSFLAEAFARASNPAQPHGTSSGTHS